MMLRECAPPGLLGRRNPYPAGRHLAGAVHAEFVEDASAGFQIGGGTLGEAGDVEKYVAPAAIGTQETESLCGLLRKLVSVGRSRMPLIPMPPEPAWSSPCGPGTHVSRPAVADRSSLTNPLPWESRTSSPRDRRT